MSGSQTFSELHFSEEEGNKTPEPTFSASLNEREGSEGRSRYVNLQYHHDRDEVGLIYYFTLNIFIV